MNKLDNLQLIGEGRAIVKFIPVIWTEKNVQLKCLMMLKDL